MSLGDFCKRLFLYRYKIRLTKIFIEHLLLANNIFHFFNREASLEAVIIKVPKNLTV